MIATGIALSLLASTLGGVSSDRDFHEVLNGNSLHFRVRGQDASKPYLLLLHGGPGFSSHMFYPWGSTLEQNLNVVYLDQRGCGESASLKPNDFAAYTMPGLIADIEAVRDYLKVKKWFVLGHSWGGMLGLEYVRANPKSVLGYIHVDGLLSQPMTQDGILDFAEGQIKKDEAATDADTKARGARLKPYIPYARGLKPGLPKLLSTNQFAMSYFQEMYYADPAAGMAYNTKIREALTATKTPLTVLGPKSEPTMALEKTYGYSSKDLTSFLPDIKTRVLVINGKQDAIITPAQAAIVAKGIPNAKLVLLDKCGHFPFAEQPTDFTKLVLSFVK